jgi:putative ABC transport system permease protein
LHLVTGRLLADADVRSTQMIAVVNERFARERLNGRAPLGQVIHVPRLKSPPFNIKDDAFQIVGVVGDVRNRGLAEPVMPEIYIPFSITGIADRLYIRSSAPGALLTRAIVAEVHAVDPSQPVDQARQLDTLLAEEEFATPRFSLALFLVFGILGLSLAIVGVYGVMSTVVAQQSHEIGVRLALGAERGRIIRMIVGRGARLLGVGVIVGLIGSAIASRFVAGQFLNVPTFDPLAFGVVASVLFAAGLLACLWPALRAGRIDPITALRID